MQPLLTAGVYSVVSGTKVNAPPFEGLGLLQLHLPQMMSMSCYLCPFAPRGSLSVTSDVTFIQENIHQGKQTLLALLLAFVVWLLMHKAWQWHFTSAEELEQC